jgi:hypothetical protein
MKKYSLSFLVGVIGMISVLSCRTTGLALFTLFLSAVAIGILAADRERGMTLQTVVITFIAIGGYTLGSVIVVIFLPQFIK